jgi:hypothetical protein
MTPSLRRMLVAFYQKCGGAENLGEILGEIVMNPEVPDSTKLRAIEGIIKTTGAIFPDEGDITKLGSIEEVDAELAKMEAEEASENGEHP